MEGGGAGGAGCGIGTRVEAERGGDEGGGESLTRRFGWMGCGGMGAVRLFTVCLR